MNAVVDYVQKQYSADYPENNIRVVGRKNHSSFVLASLELPYILLIISFKKVLQCQEDVALLQTHLIIEIHNGMR